MQRGGRDLFVALPVLFVDDARDDLDLLRAYAEVEDRLASST